MRTHRTCAHSWTVGRRWCILLHGMIRICTRSLAVSLLCALFLFQGTELVRAQEVPEAAQDPAVQAPAEEILFPANPPTLRVNQFMGVEDRDLYTVSPTRFLETMRPGEEKTFNITILNKQGETILLKITKEDFRGEPETGFPQFYEVEGPYPASNWLVPEVDRLTLNHGQMATVTVRVRVPEKADPGDHMAAIVLQRDDIANGEQGGFQIKARIAVQFIISVEGATVRQAQISSFSAEKFWNWSLPVNFSVVAHNRGTVHMEPSGSIDIRNFLGTIVSSMPVSDWYVLRNSQNARAFAWQPGFALGYYTATLDVQLLAEQEPIALTLAFVVLPIVPFLIILGAIFGVSLLVQLFFSRFEVRTRTSKVE